MAYKNNHYVPQLILRRFGERLCTYNIKSGEFKTQQDTASVFSEYEFYPVEVEKEFNALAEWYLFFSEKRELLGTANHLLYICRKQA